MKIIVVTPAAPDPFGDTAARWFYALTTELASRGNEVVLLTATEEADARIGEAERRLKSYAGRAGGKLRMHFHRLKVDGFAVRRKLRSLIQPGSELIQDREFVALVRGELVKGYDILHLEQMSTGWLGINVPRALLNVHFFDAIDFQAKNGASLGERKALWQAKRATRELLSRIPNVRLLTPRLLEEAKTICPANQRGERYWMVPLALDTSLYEMQALTSEPVVGLIGSMHWEPSRSAAKRLITRIFPKVKERVPQAKLSIAGWNALKYLSEFAGTDITLRENVAHPAGFFASIAVMAYAPARGSGMKVKVMESMAYGVPVVTTWEGVEGIEYQNGEHCWVGESDEELARRICELLENRGERERMRVAARKLIEERYSPGVVVDQMMGIYGEMLLANEVNARTVPCT